MKVLKIKLEELAKLFIKKIPVCDLFLGERDRSESRFELEEIIETRGHKVIFYSKFHCELRCIGGLRRDIGLKGTRNNIINLSPPFCKTHGSLTSDQWKLAEDIFIC
ncbi:172_t:CDS:2 [Ambispora leptoticha]|uniref:172_t:CDS:1 n=1 Tax=Ambispora leptoticha TaxID=144679 RepID=A0A9N9GCL4_9GLOM|nr:172_t:CDS:2 [Ambispora leptoticha]